MIPQFPEFKPFSIADRPVFNDYIARFEPVICEHNAANLLAWQDFDRPQITFLNNNLCILVEPVNELPFFLPPIGNERLVETTEQCLEKAGALSRVPKEMVAKLGLHDTVHIRDHDDYVYQVGDLVELKGKRFDGKRNHLHKFHLANPFYDFAPLCRAHEHEAMQVFEGWVNRRKTNGNGKPPDSETLHLAVNSQREALHNCFRFFDELQLIGGALFIKKKLAGFIIGSRLNRSTVALHFEYGDLDVPGLMQFLISEGCRLFYSHFEMINLEQDLGLEGLRKTKLSYQPVRLIEKYHIQRKVG